MTLAAVRQAATRAGAAVAISAAILVSITAAPVRAQDYAAIVAQPIAVTPIGRPTSDAIR